MLLLEKSQEETIYDVSKLKSLKLVSKWLSYHQNHSFGLSEYLVNYCQLFFNQKPKVSKKGSIFITDSQKKQNELKLISLSSQL